MQITGVKVALNLQVNIPISNQISYVTMETILKNAGDGSTLLRWILKK
jgi:hypothetical protein